MTKIQHIVTGIKRSHGAKGFFIFLVGCLLASASFGQTIAVKGLILNTDELPLAAATVVLVYKDSKDSIRTISNERGEFTLSRVEKRQAILTCSHVGYQSLSKEIDLSAISNELNLPAMQLAAGSKLLENVSLESTKVQIKEDTVSFLIDSTMYRKNDNVEELLKKLPGVQVDKSGTVTAQGKEVTKVKVNGKNFLEAMCEQLPGNSTPIWLIRSR